MNFLRSFRHQTLLLRSSVKYLADVGEINAVSLRHYKAKWVAPTLRDLKARKNLENDLSGGPKVSHRNTFLEW